MIKIINSYFESSDDRGSMFGIINQFKWEEINYFFSKKNSTRGGHYHKDTKELFFIQEGKIEISLQKINNNKRVGKIVKKNVIKNDIFIIEENMYHEFFIQEDSKWINALTKKHDINSPDFHNIKE